MENTKHDLSAGLVELDYEALIQTAGTAYRCTLEEIKRYVSKLEDIGIVNADNTARRLDANWLKESAQRLAIVAETYAVLLEGKKREEVKIVNKEF